MVVVIKVGEAIKDAAVAAIREEVALRVPVAMAVPAEVAAAVVVGSVGQAELIAVTEAATPRLAAEGRSTAIAVAVLLAPVTQDVVPALQLVDNFIDLINQESD